MGKLERLAVESLVAKLLEGHSAKRFTIGSDLWTGKELEADSQAYVSGVIARAQNDEPTCKRGSSFQQPFLWVIEDGRIHNAVHIQH